MGTATSFHSNFATWFNFVEQNLYPAITVQLAPPDVFLRAVYTVQLKDALCQVDPNAEELAFPDSWQSRAAAAAVDTDPQSESIGATTRVALINARIGQGNYRRGMMTIWGGRCVVTGCTVPEVLVASHALAWAHASNEARLDPYNGLLLIATLDRLFDHGLIGFDDNGTLLRHPRLTAHDLQTLGVTEGMGLRLIRPAHRPYLAAHRQAAGLST